MWRQIKRRPKPVTGEKDGEPLSEQMLDGLAYLATRSNTNRGNSSYLRGVNLGTLNGLFRRGLAEPVEKGYSWGWGAWRLTENGENLVEYLEATRTRVKKLKEEQRSAYGEHLLNNQAVYANFIVPFHLADKLGLEGCVELRKALAEWSSLKAQPEWMTDDERIAFVAELLG
jgi:hypothetical protein